MTAMAETTTVKKIMFGVNSDGNAYISERMPRLVYDV
jgi:hypothetical protein